MQAKKTGLIATYRGDSNGFDSIFSTFSSQGFRKSNETHFGRAVVGLSEVSYHKMSHISSHTLFQSLAIDSCSTGRVDDASKLLFPEDRPSGLGTGECPLKVDFHDLIPLLVCHILETDAS